MSIQSFQNQHEQAYASLMRGLTELDLQGPCVPSDLLLIGDHAFPLALNSQGHVLMAASLYGSGRIVVLGHEGYLTAFPALVENAVTWLRGDGSDNLSVGVHRNVSAVADNLQKSSFQAEVVGAFSDNPKVGVYVTDTSSVGSDPVELVAFMKAGGGVLLAGQAWSWAADHPKENTLHQFDGNKVSGVAGIYFSDHKGDVENLPVYPQIPSSWMSVVIGKDFEDDLQFLLQGVSEFELPSDATASELLVHGPLAFPIGTTNEGRVFLAGGYYGQGRVIVTTHEGFMGFESLAPFWQNAIHWLDEGRRGVVGVTEDRALNILSKSGLQCEKANFRKDLSVFVCTLYITEHLEEIQNFVAEGGGLLIGGHAWWWAYTHPGQNVLTEFSGNQILNKMGLSLLDSTIRGGSYKAPEPSKAIKDTYHFRHLLNRFAAHVTADEQLTDHEQRCLKRLGTDCNAYLQMKAHDSAHYRQVLATLTDVFVKSGLPQVSEKNPVKSPKDHLLLTVGTQLYKVSPNPDALLPYLLKDNPLMPVVYNQRIKIDVKTTDEWEEWISTGLYLSPGMKTYVSIPPEIVNKNWKIQIGCQTDKLHEHDELRRPPCVHERFDVTSKMMQIGNLWGGLIYLVAPPKTEVKGVVATVQMAVPAPYYKSGVTTLAQWSLLRTAPSPWAELEFENIILIVPSDAVRNLERPDEVAALWDEITRAIADLAAKPHKFPRKERFLSDVQISHGYMHAGYPVMAHSDSAAEVVGVKKGKGMWGSIHELGHNQQRGCWEFPPHTTECTCNLWSVYVHEEVLGINRAQAHEAVNATNRKNRMDEYIKGGRNLNDWSVFLALETYLQLQEKFGWDGIKKVFAAYHHMSNFPGDNKGKMNLYAETFSKTVGMNLIGFFKAWGWPIETATEEKVSSLPPWSDHPMTQYD